MSRTHMYFPWQGAPGVGSGEAQWFWLFWSLPPHPMCLRFLWDSTDFRRRDLRGPTPVGAPLDLASRSPFRLRSARTLSTTLLGFEFLQRPQHVLSNLLDRPHSSVLARSTTIASSSAFSLAFALAFSPVSALRLPVGNPLLLELLFALNGAFCGWPGRGERLLRAKLFWGGAGARNQVQSRAEYRCTLLSSSASSQRDLAAPL